MKRKRERKRVWPPRNKQVPLKFSEHRPRSLCHCPFLPGTHFLYHLGSLPCCMATFENTPCHLHLVESPLCYPLLQHSVLVLYSMCPNLYLFVFINFLTVYDMFSPLEFKPPKGTGILLLLSLLIYHATHRVGA